MPTTTRLILCLAAALLAVQAAELTIDGKLDEPLWGSEPARALVAAEAGVPAASGGDVRVVTRASYLYLAGRFPEPGGRVLAMSYGRNPVWERDALESPEVEDRVIFRLQYKSTAGVPRDVAIAVNPWGACRIEEGGSAVDSPAVLPAARVTPEGWTVEVAIPAAALEIGREGEAVAVRVRAERVRSRRALAPEFRWSWPAKSDYAAVSLPAKGGQPQPPVLEPPPIGNLDAPLEIGRVLRLPPLSAAWEDAAWQKTPGFELPRNEPYPRAPRHPTTVKWVHDGRKLALFLRMTEPEPVVARAGGRDSGVASDDHVALYLATSGSASAHILVNTVGAIADAVSRGPRRMRPQSGWNAAIATHTEIRHGYWTARIDIPLDECAAALGETGVPRQWRLLVERYRASRPGEAAEQSSLPVIGGASTFYGPMRYRRAILSDADPLRGARVAQAPSSPPRTGLAGELAALDPNVWTPAQRRHRGARDMVGRYLQKRIEQAVLAERRAWEEVRTRADWESFRDTRLAALRASTGVFPPERPPLDPRVTAVHSGEGYRLENVVFQVRRGYWMSANLYLPARRTGKVPVLIIVHSQHFPKIQGELHDMGELWARTGAAVLVMERPGYGERVETTPWYRQAYASRDNFTKELFLVGESYSGWAAWDIIRCVDYVHDRPEIDSGKIVLLGSVAGGGEPAGVAAALDPRITAVVPYNYDQGHVRVHGDSPGQIAGQFSPWLAAASVAPRRFVRAFEFGWEGAEEPDYPNLWFDGYERSRKVWGFYNALDNLATAQAYGLIRLSMERVSHCFSIGPRQRDELYPIFERWFGIPKPTGKDLEILQDSGLSVNPEREAARLQEAQRRRPHADLLSIPPAASVALDRRGMHRIAQEMGQAYLRAARAKLEALAPAERAGQLRKELRAVLGDIEPAASARGEVLWRRSLRGAEVEALSLPVEDGIDVPLLVLRPAGSRRVPAVVAVAQGGKARFLASRASDIEALLASGIAVCLPDVRGAGETSPGDAAGDNGAVERLARMEFDLARSLLGSRLKDLRTVLAYLRTRPDLDGGRLALWGDSFAPSNPENLYLDEIEFESGPQVQHRADPAGAHLALLGALYEPEVRAVAARGGLGGYLSVLDDAFNYVPMDAILLGVLKSGDLADIAGALAPRPVALDGLVNGRNISPGEAALKSALEPAFRAYAGANASARLSLSRAHREIGPWLAAALMAR